MKTQDRRSAYLPLLITAIAVVMFSTAGIARMMGWGPNATDNSGDTLALHHHTAAAPAAGEARVRRRCPECGVIVSRREIEWRKEEPGPGAADGVTAGDRNERQVKSTGGYEIMVHMADGSSRVIDDANPARWRTGERVIVIDGTNPSHQ